VSQESGCGLQERGTRTIGNPRSTPPETALERTNTAFRFIEVKTAVAALRFTQPLALGPRPAKKRSDDRNSVFYRQASIFRDERAPSSTLRNGPGRLKHYNDDWRVRNNGSLRAIKVDVTNSQSDDQRPASSFESRSEKFLNLMNRM
jgi:hypothetical protein